MRAERRDPSRASFRVSLRSFCVSMSRSADRAIVESACMSAAYTVSPRRCRPSSGSVRAASFTITIPITPLCELIRFRVSSTSVDMAAENLSVPALCSRFGQETKRLVSSTDNPRSAAFGTAVM